MGRACYRFLMAADLAAAACFFFSSALLACAAFCEDFFWFALGDLSPMILSFYCGLTGLRHVSFSAGTRTVVPQLPVVNHRRTALLHGTLGLVTRNGRHRVIAAPRG